MIAGLLLAGILVLFGVMIIGQIAPNCQNVTPRKDQPAESPQSPAPSDQPSPPNNPVPDPAPTPAPDPIPDPIPDPPSPPSGGTFFISNWRDQFTDLHGVNFLDPVLRRAQNSAVPSATNNVFVNRFLDLAQDSGFNVLRIPVHWEAYEGAETIFLNELALITEEADQRGIAVWIEVHHFYTSSNWAGYGGSGFPKSLTDCYDPSGAYETDPEVIQFWADYFNNDMRDRANNCQYGLNVWDRQSDFMIDMADRINGYDNVIGYEIINEPHVWNNDQYVQLGDLHTYIGNKIKPHASGKAIIFTRETAHGFNPDGTPYGRSTGLEPYIIPRVGLNTEIIYAPHVYDLPDLDFHISRFHAFYDKWTQDFGYTNIRLMIGEFAAQPPQLPAGEAVTYDNMLLYVTTWKAEGWAFTYWAFGGFNQGEGNVLANSDGTLTLAGQYYNDAIYSAYGSPIQSVALGANSLIMAIDVCAFQMQQTQSTIFMLMGILSFGLVIKSVLWLKDRYFY